MDVIPVVERYNMNSNQAPMLGRYNNLGCKDVQRAAKNDLYEPNRDTSGSIRAVEKRAWKKDQEVA